MTFRQLMITEHHSKTAQTLPSPPTSEEELSEASASLNLPFVVGILADLSGMPAAPLPPLRERSFIDIDRDNFPVVMQGLRPRLVFCVPNTLANDGSQLTLTLCFTNLSDFEPAHLITQVDPLARLLPIRAILLELLTRSQDDELFSVLPLFSEPGKAIVDALTADMGGQNQASGSDEESLVARLVTLLDPEMLVAKRSTRVMLQRLIVSIDQALSNQLNVILHASPFQQLEASWRGLYSLISRIEPDTNIKVRVLHVTKKELLDDLDRASEFDQSSLFKKVYEEEYATFGGFPVSVLLGDYTFGRQLHDVALLQKLSEVAAAAHAPFIAAAAPEMFGIESFTQLHDVPELAKIFGPNHPHNTDWLAFRATHDARFIGLCLPRILWRLPYRPETQPAHTFAFEEDMVSKLPTPYLWGNAAYAFVARLVEAFVGDYWCTDFCGPDSGRVTGFPAHTFYYHTGESGKKGPAEVVLNDLPDMREQLSFIHARELVNFGFIPLCQHPHSDHVAFLTAPSVYEPVQSHVSSEAHISSLDLINHLLPVCRIAHHLMVMCRDILVGTSPATCEQYLNRWLSMLTAPHSQSSQVQTTTYPLREAWVEVRQSNDWWHGYHVIVYLKPFFQGEESDEPLQLVLRLEGL